MTLLPSFALSEPAQLTEPLPLILIEYDPSTSNSQVPSVFEIWR